MSGKKTDLNIKMGKNNLVLRGKTVVLTIDVNDNAGVAVDFFSTLATAWETYAAAASLDEQSWEAMSGRLDAVWICPGGTATAYLRGTAIGLAVGNTLKGVQIDQTGAILAVADYPEEGLAIECTEDVYVMCFFDAPRD